MSIIAQYGGTVYKKLKFAQKIKPYKALKGVGVSKTRAELLKGVNIGGLGTLIASMASLISYKLYVKEMPEKKGKYMTIFSILNIVFAIVLLVLEFIL